MKTKKNFNTEINQYELSYEFLYLLKWLVEHEGESLKKIIARAVRNGFKKNIDPINLLADGVQTSIIDFLDLLDNLLVEVIHENHAQHMLDRTIIPALDQIDSKIYDKNTLETSLEKATAGLTNFPEKKPEEILFKELLKRWKPSKNQTN